MKKNRDPRWEEEFQFMVDEPPTNDKMHVEVVSTSSRNLLHSKVHNLLIRYGSVLCYGLSRGAITLLKQIILYACLPIFPWLKSCLALIA